MKPADAAPGAAADLERVFADGYSRYQMVMAGTQAVRALAYRSSMGRTGNALNFSSAGVAVAESIRRRREAVRGADPEAFSRVGPTVAATALLVAATPAGEGAAVSWAVLWGHLTGQWVAAGVGIFDRSPARKTARTAALLTPLGFQTLRRPSTALAAFRTAAGFGAFMLVGEVLTRRLRTAAARIDETVETLLYEREDLAQRMEDERIARSVIDSAADELDAIGDLLVLDRAAAATRAAGQEALLRAWVSNDEVASLDAPPDAPAASDFGSQATQSLDRANRITEVVLRLSGTLPLIIHATWTRSRATRLVAWMAAANALWTSYELRKAEPRRRWIAASDLTTSAMATLLAAQQSHGQAESAEYPSAEALIGYVASLAPCAGTMNADPALARSVTVTLAALLGTGALLSEGGLATRTAMGAERIAMASGGSWFSHWVKDLILDQTAQLSSATDQLSQARAEAAAASARRWRQYLIHDSALQVLLWVQKPDLSDAQLTEWISREVARLQEPRERDDGRRMELAAALADLVSGFEGLGLQPSVEFSVDVELSTNVVIVVVEILNEALTNVMKHSNDSAPDLRLTTAGDDLMIRVTNRYHGPPPTRLGTGSGSLADRAQAVGGSVSMWQDDGCFHLGASLPMAPVSDQSAAAAS